MTNHAGVYTCVVTLFAQKWYLQALLTTVLYLTLLTLLLKKVYSTAGLCTMKFKLVYGRLKHFFTLSLRNDLVVCGSSNLIELCYSLVYSK